MARLVADRLVDERRKMSSCHFPDGTTGSRVPSGMPSRPADGSNSDWRALDGAGQVHTRPRADVRLLDPARQDGLTGTVCVARSNG
jgi:hypothetical protein